MVDKLLNRIFELPIVRSFKINTTPRWIILLIDMLIVTVSYAMLVFSDMYASHTVAPSAKILLNWAILVVVYFLVTYISKSYTCVIRLSVIEDLYRTILVVVTSTLLLFGINAVVHISTSSPLFRYWSVILIGAVSFSIMMIERLLIKYFYMRLTAINEGRRRVLVLGTSLDSLILANALKSEIGGKYEPVGLLSIKNGKENEQINGFKVYRFDPENLTDIFVGNSIYALIFNASNNEMMRNGLADHFIRNNIALLSINKVEEFELDTDKENNTANISTFIKEVQIEDLLGRDPIVLNNSLVSSNVKGQCVLITGAAGSIGSEIVRQVAAYNASKIVLIDQAESPMHDLALELQKSFPQSNVELFMGDVQNADRMEMAFKKFKPRFVFHAAAYKHVPMMEINPTEAVLTNVLGTKNMADLSLKYGVYKFVMISTDKAVNPTNIMGCTKRLAEIYCQSLFFDARRRGLNTQFITTRFGNVLGSNGSVIPLFRKQIEQGGPITVTHRDIIRYFMTIPEACSLVLEAGCMGAGGEIYIFDMGKPVKIYDLATRMISLAGLKPGVDIQIKEIGLRPGEKLYEELLNDKEKTTATINKKIMIAKVRTYDYRDVCDHIEQIVDFAATGNIHHMVYAMKQFVPEYKSNHSEFEAIDREIEENSVRAVELTTPETEKYY
ncbi:MAG: polysaccharide biosynthesis protein [Muribaculaceae bacterium]|nr:polysaccharide biosynthesis protein [Muribaculaceae bacterium]